MMKQDNQLTTRAIPILIRRIAVPASVGYFFNTMYNVVDTYYSGLISTQALAALSLSFPVFFIIISMGTGISTGATALIATALGADNRVEARLFAIQGIVFGTFTALFLTAAGIQFAPFLFTMLGASADYLLTCLSYMNTLFSGTLFFLMNYMFNAILNAMGDTRSFRNFLIIGFLFNIVLDPWFIYGGFGVPPMGVFGIALATVLIQMVGTLYLGSRVRQSGLLSGSATEDFLPRLRPLKEIAHQGLPASLNMMTVGIGIFVITYFISRFGKEAVAAYGIATRVEQIVLLPTIGLNIATLTIVAQNNGAGLYHRIRETVSSALRYGGILMTMGTFALFAFAGHLMELFTGDATVVEIGTRYLKIAAFLLYAYVILYVNIASLQGIKKPIFAIWIGLFRQIAAPLLVFRILTHEFAFGLGGIWWGIFFINWSAAVFTLFYARHLLNRLVRKTQWGSSTQP